MANEDSSAEASPAIPSPPPEPKDERAIGTEAGKPAVTPVKMPIRFFVVSLSYLVALIVIFVIFATSPTFRHSLPTNFGPLPMAVVWFGATGAVVASLRGIFMNNANWDESYNYWHYSRPLYGAVTGSIGALIYWVSLRLGTSKPVSVDSATFDVVAFLLGFSGNAFMELLKNVTDVIIKPGQKSSAGMPPTQSSTGAK